MPPTRKPNGPGQHTARRSYSSYGAPNFAGLPRTCRQKIFEKCSVSSLLALYSTCRNFRFNVPRSSTIVNEVFSNVYGLVDKPQAVSKIMRADRFLHPLFAKAIAESYDGFRFGDDDDDDDGSYFVFLIKRCTVVHDIDAALSRAGKSTDRGLRRKMALLTFWRMLDCIENWTKDKQANGLGGHVSAGEYFGWCVDIVGGFSHMMRTEEERRDICKVVESLYALGPENLVKGWTIRRPWPYLGWRARMIGFCLLGGLERVANALSGRYFLKEMTDERGLDLEIERGILRWTAFEEGERKEGRLLLKTGRGGRK